MEFTINTKEKNKREKKPRYVVHVDFMEGDADGYQTDKLKFYADDETDMLNLPRFVLAVAMCCAAYPRGRGGYDEYNGLAEYDAFFSEEVYGNHYDFLDENGDLSEEELDELAYEYVKKLNPDGYYMDHPSDSSYISTSFDGYNIVFIDSKGNKSPVEVTFNEEELAKIEKAKTYFR